MVHMLQDSKYFLNSIKPPRFVLTTFELSAFTEVAKTVVKLLGASSAVLGVLF